MQEKNEFNQPVGQLIKNWLPAKKPAQITLSGNDCRLEAMNVEKHADELFVNLSLNNQGESWTYLPYGPFADKTAFRTWLTNTIAEPDTVLYTIVCNNLSLGIAGYLRINPEHGVIEIGHLHFAKLLQRSKAATEALYLLICYAFDDLGYRRCEWKCHSLNTASKNAALRLGFKFEGTFRQSNIFKQRNRDTTWFSIIDNEWPALKNKFQRWFDIKNFDAAGKQIKSLNEV